MNRNKVLLLAMLLSLALACNITQTPNGGATPNVGSTLNTPPVGSTPNAPPVPTSVPSDPVSIRAGLASLNTYTLVIESNFSGPTQADYSQTHFEIKKSTDLDATSTHYVITRSSEGDSEPSTTDSYSYTIGDAKCSGSDEDGWDYTETTLQQTEMQELFGEMMDIVPLNDAPTFVGSETMNGIMTNHFTFRVSGLGLQSAAEVTANQGDYWLAQDGQYIVKYFLVTETLDTTTQTTLHMEVLIDLTSINQPVDIAFPAGCVP